MNDKTAKLISKYAGRSNEDKTAIKRRWLAMSHRERTAFRQEMLQALGRDAEPAADEPAADEPAADEPD